METSRMCVPGLKYPTFDIFYKKADGSCLWLCVVNGSHGGRPVLETFLPNMTEFTLRLPVRAARYKLFLSARTQVGFGEELAEEVHLFTNEGMCMCVCD